MNVITYQTPTSNDKINLTPDQVSKLRAADVWPRNKYGYYSNVHYGQHRGTPTFEDAEIERAIAGEDIAPGIAFT